MQKSNTRQIAPKSTKNGFLPLKTNRTKKVRDNESMGEWKHINWHKLERRVFKLQKRIYKASRRGDVKAFRRLQKTLINSWGAKCLSVRRVTQDNQGKKTAGVDGIKSLSPEARLALVAKLKPKSKVKPTRRVWIPKPGTEEKRPLGIPVMNDRALQALFKLALEPEWEARFEPNSYGFRPGRSCHDAIDAIFKAIVQKSKFVLDADIAKCFDRIDHEALLRKLNTSPTIRRQIRAWLKAGVMDGGQLFPTSVSEAGARTRATGTPQGGVISPLLAKKYWQTIGGDNWVFATRQEGKNPMRLRSHTETKIIRHVKVEGDASPYDGNLIYWSSRMGTHPETTTRVATLLKSQSGKCTHCGMYFREEDVLEIDHITPKSLGGKDDYKNLQILHRHCHDEKTTVDGSVVKYA